MNLKWMGAVCVILACGSCGFMIAAQHIGKIQQLRSLIGILDYMKSELLYRGPSLPQLCRQAGEQGQGKLQRVFCLLAEELDAQISPDACCCMASVLDKLGCLDSLLYGVLLELGRNLGKFDISGQIRGLECTRNLCSEKLDALTQNKEHRVRSYQALGLCAGAAIAILFV